MIRSASAILAFLSLLRAAPLHAQRTTSIRLGMGVAELWTTGGDPSAPLTARGTALHAELGAQVAAVGLRLDYLDGTLAGRGPAAGDAEVVEGSVVASVHASPWLAVEGGLRAERISQSVDERWVHWVAGVRLDLPIILGSLRGHAVYHHSLHTSVNFPQPGGSERFAEAGMTATSPGGRIWAEVTGTSERSLSDAGILREIEGVRLTVGVRIP